VHVCNEAKPQKPHKSPFKELATESTGLVTDLGTCYQVQVENESAAVSSMLTGGCSDEEVPLISPLSLPHETGGEMQPKIDRDVQVVFIPNGCFTPQLRSKGEMIDVEAAYRSAAKRRSKMRRRCVGLTQELRDVRAELASPPDASVLLPLIDWPPRQIGKTFAKKSFSIF
jgi:hypothetical protein